MSYYYSYTSLHHFQRTHSPHGWTPRARPLQWRVSSVGIHCSTHPSMIMEDLPPLLYSVASVSYMGHFRHLHSNGGGHCRSKIGSSLLAGACARRYCLRRSTQRRVEEYGCRGGCLCSSKVRD
jgi:hypothetical protein